ncbi:MAG: hypothetical protein CTY31_11835 [Hyphomicrobium sp.]|nr:MAG: hypothetical protein CTY39_03715 [Hyphomicrobium sp.]PPC98718.1 MAG: hypothetical protein CTY31_11835 [Hyphomicrobium sp.]
MANTIDDTDPRGPKPTRNPEQLPKTPDGSPPRPGNPIDEPRPILEEAPGPDPKPEPIQEPDESDDGRGP